jgi:tetratricopeptide (TPR) repeat protein
MRHEGDKEGLIRAVALSGRLKGRRGHFRAAIPEFEESGALAEQLGDDYASANRLIVSYLLLESDIPVDECLDRIDELARDPRLGRQVRVRINAIVAVLYALAGQRAEAEAILGDVHLANSSPAFWGAEAPRMAALAQIILGNLDGAEVFLRFTVDQFTDALLRLDGGGLGAYLLALQGRPDEAIAASEQAEALVPPGNIDDKSMWRMARALGYSRLGHHDEAERYARQAVALTVPTVAPRWQGNTLFVLAQVLAADGRQGAREFAEEALGRYEAKGAVTLADPVRAFIASL